MSPFSGEASTHTSLSDSSSTAASMALILLLGVSCCGEPRYELFEGEDIVVVESEPWAVTDKLMVEYKPI